jgi:hypothetical protein
VAQVGLEPTAFDVLSVDGLPLPTEPGLAACGLAFAITQGGPRTHSIGHFKCPWSAHCLPGQPKFRGLESNQHQRVQSPMSYRLDDPEISGH